MIVPSGCAFNFVFGDEDLYIGTADHCVDTVGPRVTASGVGNGFALTRIDPREARPSGLPPCVTGAARSASRRRRRWASIWRP